MLSSPLEERPSVTLWWWYVMLCSCHLNTKQSYANATNATNNNSSSDGRKRRPEDGIWDTMRSIDSSLPQHRPQLPRKSGGTLAPEQPLVKKPRHRRRAVPHMDSSEHPSSGSSASPLVPPPVPPTATLSAGESTPHDEAELSN